MGSTNSRRLYRGPDVGRLKSRAVAHIIIAVLAACCGNTLCEAQVAVKQPDILSMYLFNGNDESKFKRNLEQGIDLQVTRVAEIVGLDTEQLGKLRLAAHGDKCRFYRELERVREKTKELNPQNNADIQKAWQEIAPLQQRIVRGLIDENSLLEKVLGNLLNAEQSQKYQEFQRERRLRCYKSILMISIADWEKSLPLTAKQRDELIKLLLSQDFPRQADAQTVPYVGSAMIARLKDEQIAEILDEQQQKTFVQLRAQHAGSVHMFKW